MRKAEKTRNKCPRGRRIESLPQQGVLGVKRGPWELDPILFESKEGAGQLVQFF